MIVYAETFGVQPHEVGQIKLLWWQRWLLWTKAKQARQAFDRLLNSDDETAELSGEEVDLIAWSSNRDEPR